MNRRGFIKAVGAVSVAAYAPWPKLAESVAARSSDLLYRLDAWQKLIWLKLQEGKDVIYVTSTVQKARHVYDLFKRPKNLHCVNVNGALMGRRADFIMIDDFTDQMNPDWYDCAVRTRLVPGADPIEWVHT
jgi:hypothetical protein